MKNLKEELKKIAENWDPTGRYDGTTFEDRFFIDDLRLDRFARKYGLNQLTSKHEFDGEKVEAACDCEIIYDYDGANPNRQFGNSEIIFNHQELYIVSAGIWDIDPTPRATVEAFQDYIFTAKIGWEGELTIERLFEHDDDRLEYEQLKEIAGKNHNWRNMLYADEDWISGSVLLTDEQAEELEETFFLQQMSELLNEETENA